MGFLSNLKNSITGGWADVSVSAGRGRRGESLDVAVEVNVRDSDVTVDQIYVQLTCREIVEIDNVCVHTRNDEGGGGKDYVDVSRREELFGNRYAFAGGQHLEANSQQTFAGSIEIPPHLPPSYRGRHSRIEWCIHAGLDMKGNDPDSGAQALQVD